MLEGVHDEDGQAQPEDVSQEAGVEVRPAVLLQAADTQTHSRETLKRSTVGL